MDLVAIRTYLDGLVLSHEYSAFEVVYLTIVRAGRAQFRPSKSAKFLSAEFRRVFPGVARSSWDFIGDLVAGVLKAKPGIDECFTLTETLAANWHDWRHYVVCCAVPMILMLGKSNDAIVDAVVISSSASIPVGLSPSWFNTKRLLSVLADANAASGITTDAMGTVLSGSATAVEPTTAARVATAAAPATAAPANSSSSSLASTPISSKSELS